MPKPTRKEWIVPVCITRRSEVFVIARTAEEAKRYAADGQFDDEVPGEIVECETIGEPEVNE